MQNKQVKTKVLSQLTFPSDFCGISSLTSFCEQPPKPEILEILAPTVVLKGL